MDKNKHIPRGIRPVRVSAPDPADVASHNDIIAKLTKIARHMDGERILAALWREEAYTYKGRLNKCAVCRLSGAKAKEVDELLDEFRLWCPEMGFQFSDE